MYLEKILMHADAQPDADAIVHAGGSLNYRELANIVLNAAAALQQAGVTTADVVGLAIANEVEHLIAALALMAIGAGHISIAGHDSRADIDYVNQQVRMTVMLTDRDREYPGFRCIEWPLAVTAPTRFIPEPQQGMSAVILATSGTTGTRRFVAVSESHLSRQALRHPEYGGERLLRLAPIHFNNSKRHRLYCVWLGGTNVFYTDTSAEQLIEFVQKARVTSLDVSRMHLADIARAPNRHCLANVKIRPGGGPVPKSLRALIREQVASPLYVRYATTETGALAMTAREDEDSDDLCGYPLQGVDVEILRQDGQPCDIGETGTVRVKADGMADSYLNPELFAGKGWHEGWFYPGDVGWMDERGRLHVLGRADDLINLNGIKISPEEIEAALSAEAGVRCAAAFGLPSAVHGQLPVAVLEIEESQAVSLDVLLQKMREKLGVRAPRKLRIFPVIPRNHQGKILRRDLPALWRKMDQHE